MDEITNEVKKAGRGYRMGDKDIKIMCYADNAVLILKNEDNLQVQGITKREWDKQTNPP